MVLSSQEASQSNSKYYLLYQKIEIENLIEKRVKQILDGTILPTDYFVYAVVDMDEQSIEESLKKVAEKQHILPLSSTKLDSSKLWQLKFNDLTTQELLNMVSNITLTLSLSSRVGRVQRAAIQKAITEALEIDSASLKLENFGKAVGVASTGGAGAAFASVGGGASSAEGEPGLGNIQNLEENISNELDRMMNMDSDFSAGTRRVDLSYNLLYSVQFPLAALVFGLILMLIAQKYIKFKYAEMGNVPAALEGEAFKEEAPAPSAEAEDAGLGPAAAMASAGGPGGGEAASYIARDDEELIKSFVKTISDSESRYVLSSCVDDMLNRDGGVAIMEGILRLLGAGRHNFVSLLSDRTASNLLSKMKEAGGSTVFDYEVAIAGMAEFISKFELEKKAVERIGADEDLLALSNMDDTSLTNYIAEKDAKEGAMLLSLFPTKKVHSILARMPEEKRKSIYGGFANIQTFTPDAVGDVLSQLKQAMEGKVTPIVDGLSFILDMLNSMNDEDAKVFVDSVTDPDLQAEIKRNFMTASDILRLDKDGITILFGDFDPKTIAHFLYLAGKQVADAVMATQTKRNAAIIKDTLSTLSATTVGRAAVMAQAEVCKRNIINAFKEMVLGGDLTLHDTPQDHSVPEEEPEAA